LIYTLVREVKPEQFMITNNLSVGRGFDGSWTRVGIQAVLRAKVWIFCTYLQLKRREGVRRGEREMFNLKCNIKSYILIVPILLRPASTSPLREGRSA
jgi:hypothetical protein